VFLLVALALLAVGVFLFTKRIASKERQLERRVAGIWFQQGQQQLLSGEAEKAIRSFRWATADARENVKYSLALADALAAGNHYVEAQQLLLRLREVDPENAEINIRLARLTAKHGDVSDAYRYYQNALYGHWTGSQVNEQQRKLRIELIQFLIDHGQHNSAISQLLILEAEPPESAASRVEAAKLFLRAGDPQRALKNYVEAVQLDHHDVAALTGAGEVSFQLADYVKAAHYLRMALEASPGSSNTRNLLSLTEAVLTHDPLAPHLSAKERQSRLVSGFDRSLRGLENCLAQTSNDKSKGELRSLQNEALTMKSKLNQPRYPPDSDLVTSGVDLILKMEKTTADSCGNSSVPDRALLLIGQMHNGAQ
jgi:tetratricopeptide (TPR) repeat protein